MRRKAIAAARWAPKTVEFAVENFNSQAGGLLDVSGCSHWFTFVPDLIRLQSARPQEAIDIKPGTICAERTSHI
jgi:hypothetical protein